MGTSIRDDFVVKPKMKVDFVKKEGGYPFSSDGLFCGAENYPLHKAMVDHDQQRVKAGGSGEVGDQVVRDLLEGARGIGPDWGEWGDGGMCVRLVLLACSTAFNVFPHKLCKTWPPEFSGYKLASLQITGMTSGVMVMTLGEDRSTEGVVWGNVHMAFVCEDMVIEPSVREVGLEGGRDVLQR